MTAPSRGLIATLMNWGLSPIVWRALCVRDRTGAVRVEVAIRLGSRAPGRLGCDPRTLVRRLGEPARGQAGSAPPQCGLAMRFRQTGVQPGRARRPLPGHGPRASWTAPFACRGSGCAEDDADRGWLRRGSPDGCAWCSFGYALVFGAVVAFPDLGAWQTQVPGERRAPCP